jgi:UDP-3-O-[3-hydroxymyristoyl] glucosamine N-acyltransferase
MPRFSLSELQARLGGEIRGDADPILTGVGSLDNATSEQISFVVNPKYAKAAQASLAGALIVPAKLADNFSKPCLAVANPHAAFAQAITFFHPEPAHPAGIDASARVDASSQVDPAASIGPGVVIGPGARIGPRTRLDAGCVVGANVVIGSDGHLYPNVTLYHRCQLGDRVTVHAGTVIGSDGFGLAWGGDHWLKVPQVGRVLIGNDVEIGANTTIDRGALDDTIIEDGVKVDNLVQIAHNCRIGAHTAIAACSGLSGSTRIGRNCLIGGGAGTSGHLEICDGVTVSGATTVIKSIREPGVYTSTQPQMPHDEWLKNAAQLRHLADMRERIRALEKKLAELENT